MIKFKLNEKNKLSSAVLLILLVLIILGVLSYIIFGLRHFNLLELKFPAFIENLLSNNNGATVQNKGDDSDIYDFLENVANNTEIEEIDSRETFIFEISLENIRDVIENIMLPDNIYIESKAEYYHGNEISKTVETSLWKKGGKFRYHVKINSRDEILYINDGQREYIGDFTANNNIIKNSDELFSFANIPNIPDINYYLDLLEDSKIVNYVLVQTNDNENIARIKYEIPSLDQYENIFVSLDTGIVLEVRSDYGNNTTYYKYSTVVKEAYNDGAEISRTEITDSLFEIR